MKKKIFSWLIWIVILVIAAIIAGVVSLRTGSASLSFSQIISTLLGKGDQLANSIIFNIRLPRILLGLVVGGGLSLVGVMLQGMFRNPLVEPYTLGISGGACLGVALSVIFKIPKILGALAFPLAGFLGSLVVIWFLYILSMRKGVLRIRGILLCGVMLSYIASSLIMLLMAVAKTEDLHGIIMWTMGSLDEPNWVLVVVATVVSALGLIIGQLFCISLNALSLGEEEAVHLGVNVELIKKVLFLLASLLTGTFVAVTGIIGFVGLVVPHFMRLIVGRDHRILIISSYLAGGTFLILCDTIARTVILPLELPVGVVTGIIGGGLFIYALIKRQRLA